MRSFFKWTYRMRSTDTSVPRPSYRWLATLGVGLGLAVAVWVTGKGEFFWENFAAYWLPQAAVLAVALLLKASREMLGGMAIAMALYLYLFHLWASEAMAWLWYLFSFPGALIGALLAVFIASRTSFAGLAGFGSVTLGIVLNLVILFFVIA